MSKLFGYTWYDEDGNILNALSPTIQMWELPAGTPVLGSPAAMTLVANRGYIYNLDINTDGKDYMVEFDAGAAILGRKFIGYTMQDVHSEIAAISERTSRLPDVPAATGSAMTLVAEAIGAAQLASAAITALQSGLATSVGTAAGIQSIIDQLTVIKGAGWSLETLKALYELIEGLEIAFAAQRYTGIGE